MDGEGRNLRVEGANMLAVTLAGLGGALAATPDKVFSLAGMTLAGEQAHLFARMLGARDLTLAYLLLKQPTGRERRTVLAAIGGMAALETVLLTAAAGQLPVRAAALLIGSTALAGAATVVLATADEDAPAGGAELLLAGYALALPPTLERAPVIRQGRPLPFAAYTLGASLIGAGWLRRRNPPAAAVNFIAAASGVAAWLYARRKAIAARLTDG